MSRIKKLYHSFGTLRREYLYFKLWPRVFRRAAKKDIDQKLAVFAYSENYSSMPDNMRPVYESLLAKGFRCMVFDRENGGENRHSALVAEFVRLYDSVRFQKAYARCRCLYLTDFYFPAYACQPREGQSVVQLWHACGAFKKWGYSTRGKAWGATEDDLNRYSVHNTYTHVCVSSEKVRFAYADAFGCDEKIVRALGTPRTDVYFDPDFVSSGRDKLTERFPGIGNRKIILYAPTFRGTTLRESYMKNCLDFELLANVLGDEYALVLKLHPLTAKKFALSAEDNVRFGDFVFDASEGLPIETALCAADVVITDYSSLIFEYALLERPMLFFAYDLAEYNDQRSFYFDYESFVPGSIVTDSNAIVSEIKALKTDFDIERVRRFRKDFMSACDGSSTERIVRETAL